MNQPDDMRVNSLPDFIDSWFPAYSAARLRRVIPFLPENTVDDLDKLISGESTNFESISGQRIAGTCLRILGELLLDETLVFIVRAELELTHSCNFRCQYCTARRHEVGIGPAFNEDNVASLIHLYRRAGCRYIHFNGGEVSLLECIPDLVRLAVTLGMKVGISSNGSGSVEFYRRLVEAGLSYAHISCDSYSPQAFERLTSAPGAWGRTNSSLSFLCSEARRINSQLLVVANVVLTEETLRTLPSTMRYLTTLGVDDIKLMPVFAERHAPSALRKLFYTSIKPELQKILGAGSQYPMFRMRLARLFSRNIFGMEDCDKRSLTECYLQSDQVMVRADGVYAPCFIYMSRNYMAQDYGIGSVRGDLGSRSVLARRVLHETYSRNATCATRCPDIIRDANRKIQAVISDCLAAMLRQLDSDGGVLVGRIMVTAESLFGVDEQRNAVPVTRNMLAIPQIYEEELPFILRALAGVGIQVERVGDSKCVKGWEGDSVIGDKLLRLYATQSGKGCFCYRVVSTSSLDRPKALAAIRAGAVAPRRLLVSLYSKDVVRAHARIVVPPLLTGRLAEGEATRNLPLPGIEVPRAPLVRAFCE